MELTDILSLVKAGYTREEIKQMEIPQTSDPNPELVQMEITEPVTEPANPPAQVAEPVATAVPASTPQPVQNPAQEQPTMADIMQGIAKLTSAVQANAIAQSVIPGGMVNPPDASDMLAEIIRPTVKERV